jgi:hypothetical protein
LRSLESKQTRVQAQAVITIQPLFLMRTHVLYLVWQLVIA